MLVVADGGASKIDWMWAGDAGEPTACQTTGYNPTYSSAAQLEELRSELKQLPFGKQPLTLWYYGAGCKATEAARRTHDLLQGIWPQADVFVSDDLLGAARATCGQQAGIVCILGTGSNSMLYDGQRAADQIPNLGFLLGDEGSGAHIGKELLRAYFYREMPLHLRKTFDQALPEGRNEFVEQLYGAEKPGALLASFTTLVANWKEDEWVGRLVQGCFDEFIRRHVLKYSGAVGHLVHFCGSIAWHFQDHLQPVLHRHGLRIGKILSKPIGELFKFHLNNASSQPL